MFWVAVWCHIRFRPSLGKVYQVEAEQLFEDILLLFLDVDTHHTDSYADTITVKIILIMVVVLVLIHVA